ncbi:MAG: D-aminoacyl-tRNA deacylase [Firmicutes bacterium]|nr:D-aminoacyl-tRNA deacylase [Bacillota bacterium]
MRGVVQRVSRASVTVEGKITSQIGKGLLVLLGVEEGDGEKDMRYMADKVAGLRVFEDAEEKMNLSVRDVAGAVLAVSQFTLCADARHGRRPSFISAARPEAAIPLYEGFTAELRRMGIPVATGVFQAHMDVSLVNDGPVTILLDSKKGF